MKLNGFVIALAGIGILGAIPSYVRPASPVKAARRETAKTDPFIAVAKAIMWQESRGDPNAVGDGGKAIGAYQIHRAYWTDGTRFLEVSWPYSDARDPVKALAVVRAYTEHYIKAAGIVWNAENIARVHNGGPHGHRKAATLTYWRSIERIMQEGIRP